MSDKLVFRLIFIVLFLVSFANIYAANLNCTYMTNIGACTDTKIIGIYSSDNSHVEAPSQSLYTEGVCCKDSGASTETILNNAGTNYANLSSTTNAHIGFQNYPSGYNLLLGISNGNVECQLFSDTSTCESQNYSSCLFEIYNDAGNTHVLNCTNPPSNPHMCCRLRYNDNMACTDDIDCINDCDNDELSNNPDDLTCFDASSCVNGSPILGGGSATCEYDDSCGADLVCDETAPGDISIYNKSACCLNTCTADYTFADGLSWAECEYYNSTAELRWCLDEDTGFCHYTGVLDSCDAIAGWVMQQDYCPIPGTINNSMCYFNPSLNRTDDCNGAGCNVISKPINAGEFCDPYIGPTDVSRDVTISKDVVKNGDVINLTYLGKPGLTVSVDVTSLGGGNINLNYNNQNYNNQFTVNDMTNGNNIIIITVVDNSNTITFNKTIYLDNTAPKSKGDFDLIRNTLLHLSFDNNSNSLKDYSGYDRSFTEYDSPRYNDAGYDGTGYAISFDNISENRIVSTDTADLPTGTSPRSLSMWAVLDNVCGTTDCNLGGYGNSVSNQNFQLGTGFGNFYLFSWGGDWATGVDTTPYRDNNWHHYVVTYNGSRVSFYIDGVRMAFEDGRSYATTAGRIVIGNEIDHLGHSYSGKIDDFRIYNHSLSDQDITNIYNSNFGELPEIIINNGANYTNSRFVTIQTKVSDNYKIDSCSYSLTQNFDVKHSCYEFISFNLESNGLVTVYANISDYAGNWIVVNDSITVYENTRVTNISTQKSIFGGDATFNFTNGFNNYYSVDGNPFVMIGTDYVTIDTTTLYDGIHTIQIKNEWFFGGSSYSNVKLFTVDNTKPLVEFRKPINSTTNNTIQFYIQDKNINISKTNVSFNNIASTFNPSSCAIYNDGYLCTYTETGLNQLTTQITINAYDNVDNSKTITKPINFSTDAGLPVITINYPNNSSNNNPTYIDVTTNEPTRCRASFFTSTYRYMDYNLMPYSNTNHKLQLNLDSENNYTINIACKDNSGNVGVSSKTFFVDDLVTRINVIKPTKYSNKQITELLINTTENVVCRYDYRDTEYKNMIYTLNKIGNNHTDMIYLINNESTYDYENNITTSISTRALHLQFEGETKDISGNNRIFVEYDNPRYDEVGYDNVGKSITFDDVGENRIVSTDVTGLPSGNSPRSISIWAILDNVCGTTNCNLGGYGDNLFSQNFQFGTAVNRFYVWGWSYDWPTNVFTDPYRDGNWHHYVVTYNGSRTSLYIDSVRVAFDDTRTWNTNPQRIVIGNEIDNTGHSHSGNVDDFIIYEDALTDQEILDIYNSRNRKIINEEKGVRDTIYVRCIDELNNSNSGSTIIHTILDEDRPYLIFNNNEYKNSKTINFEVLETTTRVNNITISINGTQSTDFNQGAHCSESNTGFICSYTESNITQGTNKISFVIDDVAGNIMLSDKYVIYDTINPMLIVNTASRKYNNPDLILNITNTDECRWSYSDKPFESSEYTFSDGLYPTTLIEGTNTYYIKCQDNSNNKNESILTLTLDSYVSKPQITNPLPGSKLNGIITINFTNAALESTEISINGGVYNPTSNANSHIIDTRNYHDGNLVIKLVNIDDASNSAFSDITTYFIDNTPQSTYILRPVDGSAVNNVINVRTRASDEVYTLNYSLATMSSGLIKAHNYTFDTTSISDGYYNITIQAFNVVGELTDTDSIQIYVDNNISVSINCNSTLSEIANISILSKSNVLKAVLEIDDVAIAEDTSYPFEFILNTNMYESKNHTLKATIYSYSGQTNTTTKTITINNNHSITITSPNNTQVIKGIYNVTFVGDDLVNPILVIDDSESINTNHSQTSGWVLIDTNEYMDDTHKLQIIDGDYVSNEVYVNIRNYGATYLLRPKEIKNPNNVFIQIAAPDNTKYVEIYVNNTLVYNDTQVPFEYNYVNTSGTYNLVVSSYDLNGNYISNDSMVIEIDESAYFECYIPTDVTDTFVFNPNSTEKIDYIYEISSDGFDWYSIEKYWNTRSLLNGLYYIRITGTDVVGNKYNITNQTNVNNPVFGSVKVDKEYAKNGDTQKFTIKFDSSTYNVSVTNPITGDFNDNATDGDEIAEDGIYTYEFVINDNQTHEVSYDIEAINRFGYSFNLTATFYIDNQKPDGEIIVQNNEQFVLLSSDYSNVSYAEIKTTFQDNIDVDSCRVYSKIPLPFEDCTDSKIITFDDGYGYKPITYEIMDSVGNVRQINTSIIIVPFDQNEILNDKTEPGLLGQITNNLYFNSVNTYQFNYTAGYDLEAYLLQYPLRYSIAIGDTQYPNVGYDDDITFLQSGNTTKLFMTVTTPGNLIEGNTYYVNLKTENHIGLFNVTSKRMYVDYTNPSKPNITSNIMESQWSKNTDITFNYSINDTSGVAYYLYFIDRFNDTDPILKTTQSSMTFTDMVNGNWYFHIKGVDRAGNIGETRHYNFKIDKSKPTRVIASVKQKGNYAIAKWDDAFDYGSGIKDYNIIVDASDNTTWNLNTTNNTYSFVMLDNITYNIKISARNNANVLGNEDVVTILKDISPPKILVKKPRNIVNSNTVYPYIETDEKSTCYISTDQSYSYDELFESTNSIEHIDKFTLTPGLHNYFIRCIDEYENEVNDTLSFTIDESLAVTTIEIINMSNQTYVTSTLKFMVKITSDIDSNRLDDLNKNEFDVYIGRDSQEFSMKNIGNGLYEIRLKVPLTKGSKSIRVQLGKSFDEEPISIIPLSIVTSYDSPNIASASKKNNIIYSSYNNHSVGIATDAKSYGTTEQVNNILLTSDVSKGTNYLFITKDGSRINSKQAILQQNKFEELYSPSFGYPSLQSLDMALKLRYDNYNFIFNNQTNLIFSSKSEDIVNNYRLSIKYVDLINGTPTFSVDVLN